MCIGQQAHGLTRGRHMESSANTAIVSTAIGHHARARTYQQPMKPRLPRKLTTSARINLNRYWSVLGELSSNDVMKQALNFDDVDLANEINENIANELLETDDLTTRFVPVCGPENGEGSAFSPHNESCVVLKEQYSSSPHMKGGSMTLRLAPITEGSPLSSDNVSVNPEAINSSGSKFWNVFLDSSSSKRKASKSILKIVKKLSKLSE